MAVSAPLEDITVIDLSRALAGPHAGMMLGDMGARVIKVETPDGDVTRQIGPTRHPGMGPVFLNTNRSKRSICLDLKKPAGRDAVLRLIATADVLICNFRPGMLQRLGLDHATLSKDQPGLIVIEMPAFGLSGPDASYAALGPTMEMAAGMSAMIGYPGGQPTVTGPSYMDPIGGFNAAAAILTALLLGWVSATGDVVRVTLRLPAEITGVMSGLILFFLIGSEPLLRYRSRREVRAAPIPAPQPAREGSD